MSADYQPINDIDELRQFVYRILCEQNDFEPGAFQITQRILIRSGRPCGVYFCLHGPRSVKLTAIWETERNSIFFYGAGGERTLKLELQGAPQLARAA